MTYTEQYNEYVKEWIKENPAFSSPYEPMLEFDEFWHKKLEEYKISINTQDADEVFYYCQLQIEQDKWCTTQCNHCKKYYKPLEEERKKEKEL